jgi:oligosaccharide repeat unit polymerase
MYPTVLNNVRHSRLRWITLGTVTLLLAGAFVLLASQVVVLPSQIPVAMLFATFAYVNYRLGNRDVLYPGFIFSFLWFFTFALYVFCFIKVDEITLTTSMLLLSGVVAFTIGSYMAKFLPRLKGVMGYVWNVSDSGCGKVFALIWVLAIFPLFYRDIIKSAGAGWFPSLAVARDAFVDMMLDKKTPYSSILTSSLPAISVMVALVMALDKEVRGSRKGTLFAVVLAFLIGIMTTSRTQMLSLALGLIAIWHFRETQRSFISSAKKLAPAVLLLMVALGAVALVVKSEAKGKGEGGYASTQIVRYIIGGIPAFDTAIVHPERYKPVPSSNSALPRSWQPVSALFHLDDSSSRSVDVNFVEVPFPVNTYTAYYSYYLAFGMAGVPVFALFAGLLHGWLYNMAIHGSQAAMFLYCFYLYQLTMTIFADQYTGTLLLHNLEILLFMCVYYGFLRRLNWLPGELHHA